MFEEAERNGQLGDANAAAHIVKWVQILQSGPDSLERGLYKASRRLKAQPIVFATIVDNSTKIKMIHGLEEIALNNEKHIANGTVGFFLGDRLAINLEDDVHLQDPMFVAIKEYKEAAAWYKGRTATATACATNTTSALLHSDKKTKPVKVPLLFPIPIEWWGFFLTNERSPMEYYNWVTAKTRGWKSVEGKEAAEWARQWGRAARTCDEKSPESSCVHLPNIIIHTMDKMLTTWAVHSLNAHMPKPKATPTPQAARAPTPAQNKNNSPPADFMESVNNMMRLAQNVIQSTVEKNDRERTTTKQIPDTLLHRLLGLSGLTWEDRELLAPIWQQLYQQPDKAAKEIVLQSFFQTLGAQVPAFSQFHNSLLFEHILHHKFEPGPAYDTCHHGISLLAVSMRSFATQEQERQEDAWFDQATTKTPEAIKKHSSKAPPPLPTTIAELLQLLWRMIVLTTGLFTTHCSLAIQLKDLHMAIQEREQTIMGDPTSMAELIPQLAWIITSTAREFYGTICTKDDIDPPLDQTPRLAIAQLSLHTTMFKAGWKLNIANIPEQWQRQQHKTGGQPQRSNKGDGTGGKQGGADK
jgi:hypothetical protein